MTTLTLNGQAPLSYVPVRKMMTEMMIGEGFPYSTDISILPLLNLLRCNYHMNEDEASKMDRLYELEKLITETYPDPGDWPADTMDELRKLFSLVFPMTANPKVMGMVTGPFTGQILFVSPEFRRIFLTSNLEMPMVEEFRPDDKVRWRILESGIHILNKCYGKDLPPLASPVISAVDREQELDYHYKMEFLNEGIEVVNLKPKPELSEDQIHELLTNLDRPELWLKYLPPSHFGFKGLFFMTMTDVTAIEISSELRALLIENGAEPKPAEFLPHIKRAVRSFLGIPGLEVGLAAKVIPGADHFPAFMSLIANTGVMTGELFDVCGYHRAAVATGEVQIINDLKKTKSPDRIQKMYAKQGFRNLMLLPLKDPDGEVLGVVELGSKSPNTLNETHILRLANMISMMTFGIRRAMQTQQQQIDLVVQQEFTAIHPSVAWKFREIATHIFLNRLKGSEEVISDPIAFKDVHPLYGQADIVGSSTIRNKAVQEDFLKNLDLAIQLIESCQEKVSYPLLDVLLLSAKKHRQELAEYFVSSHESQIVEFLDAELHPFLREIRQVHTEKLAEVIDAYFSELDPDLEIIYRDRKAFDDSVAMLNQRVGSLIEKSNHTMQKSLPHFFEYFKTDGVEYNMYVGASLSPAYPFSPYQLKNIRLWQLVNMCEVTRLVYEMQEEMPVPLMTAQLIFVYNNSLSIRFRMDEKQFDVDGAYNVRYEIIKKRIDKATVKGKNERLTLKGKIAIVYLQEKDRKEYLEYLEYLRDRGYITDEIEDLELERLQGVEGLKALRVTVKND